MMIIPGTCSACANYGDGQCRRQDSAFAGRSLWSAVCVECSGYRRSSTPATPVSPEALAAVSRPTRHAGQYA